MGSISVTYEIEDDVSTGDKDFFSIPDPHHAIPHSATDDWSGNAGFLNITSFSDIETIELQKREERCVGLKITRHNGMRDVLGQWDGSAQEHTTIVYESHKGPLQTLDFDFQNADDPYRYTSVCQIEINRSKPAGEPPHSFRVDKLDAVSEEAPARSKERD